MKKLLFILFFLTSIVYSKGQSWKWGKQGSISNLQSPGTLVAADNKGNAYINGSFGNNESFGAYNLTSLGVDIYLVKYDTLGNIKWAVQSSVPSKYSSAYASTMTIDRGGNIIIAGSFCDTVSFGSYNLINNKGKNSSNVIFITKYNSIGNVLWAVQSTVSSSSASGSVNSVTSDSEGNSYITGFYIDTIIFGTDTLISHNDTVPSPSRLFLAKYAPNGTFLWAKQPITSKEDISTGTSIASDVSGNCYVTGKYSDTIIFGSDTLSKSMFFLTKYSSTGNVIWSKSTMNNPEQYGNAVYAYAEAVDIYGNCYVTGSFSDTATFGADTLINSTSNLIFFLVKYNSNGACLWAKQSYSLSGLFSCQGWSLSSDSSNHVYISFQGGGNSGMFKYDNKIFTFSSNIPEQVFIMKLDTLGNLLCSSEIRWGGEDGSYIASSPSGKYIYYSGNGPDTPPDTVILGKDTLSTGNQIDMPFISRWQPCNVNIPESINKTELINAQVEIFPNPNTGNFTLSLQGVSENEQITVYNILGEQVYQAPLNATTMQINLSNKAEGIYLYRVITESGTLVGEGKFVIQR